MAIHLLFFKCVKKLGNGCLYSVFTCFTQLSFHPMKKYCQAVSEKGLMHEHLGVYH